MKTIVVYDSVFGNTKKVAETIGETIGDLGEVETIQINQLTLEKLKTAQLLIIGSPTRGFEPTKPVANSLKEIKHQIYPDLKIAVFDTRMDIVKVNNKVLTFFVKFRGYAVDSMEKIILKNGFTVFHPGMGFFVEESEGPVTTGEFEKAQTWATSVYQSC